MPTPELQLYFFLVSWVSTVIPEQKNYKTSKKQKTLLNLNINIPYKSAFTELHFMK